MTQYQVLVTCLAVLAILFCLFHIRSKRKPPALLLSKNTQVMLDLETLGTQPGCKVLSIGACVFTPLGVMHHQNFYREIRRHTGQEMLAEDPETVIWWSQQPEKAKSNLLADRADDGKVTLTQALIELNKWLLEVSGQDPRGNTRVDVWGNGSDFDNIILAFAYKATNVRMGWPFWGNRCYRTLKGLTPDLKMIRHGTHHNALDDATSQAEHAVAVIKELGLWGR